MLDERPPPGADPSACTQHSMQKLAHGDDADRAFLVINKRLEHFGRLGSLEVDQQVGVDQQGHGSRGAPALVRSARTSSAKSPSGRGALAISSRKRSAETTRALGGPITATGAPLRMTSTSSPEATRLRTSEKLRATCVAVIRDTHKSYQINQGEVGHDKEQSALSRGTATFSYAGHPALAWRREE